MKRNTITTTLLAILVGACMMLGLTACGDEACEHAYDNACDASCNECGETRESTHAWVAADCDTPATCSVCGATEGEALKHTPEADDGDCTTAVSCSKCGKVVVEAKAAHAPDEDDGDCTTAVKCSACDTVTAEAKAAHTPEADDGDCMTAQFCSVCEREAVEAKDDHTDADLDGSCDICNSSLDFIYNSEEMTYYVFTAEGLYTWADNEQVYVDDDWHYSNLLLMRDIVLPTEMKFDLDGDGTNESNWYPARTSGTIDGNGYSITGMTIINETEEGAFLGFLGILSEGGTVQNLFLDDVNIQGDTGIGGIAGFTYGTIINCGVSGTIGGTSTNIGGITGNMFGGNIIACYNDADITTGDTGSIGGIVGQYSNESGKIVACYNIGSVISEGSSVGGIAGSFHSGSIIAVYSTGYIKGGFYFGGITGYGDGTFSETYWSATGDSPEYGNGYDAKSELGTKVDGKSVSWKQAMNAMNAVLEAEGTEWRYTLNTGNDADTRPLVLVKQTSAE